MINKSRVHGPPWMASLIAVVIALLVVIAVKMFLADFGATTPTSTSDPTPSRPVASRPPVRDQAAAEEPSALEVDLNAKEGNRVRAHTIEGDPSSPSSTRPSPAEGGRVAQSSAALNSAAGTETELALQNRLWRTGVEAGRQQIREGKPRLGVERIDLRAKEVFPDSWKAQILWSIGFEQGQLLDR